MKYLFIAFFLLVSFVGLSQQNHFIYLQTDNKQPFYVKMDRKLMSSTASGYLIIPKLLDSAYQLTIGFPMNEWPEQRLTCTVNQADAGYLLKNFGEKGWALFNLQSMALVMADTASVNDIAVIKVNKEDRFAEVLANVVNDPALRNIEKKEEDPIELPKTTDKRPGHKVLANKNTKTVIKEIPEKQAVAGITRIKKISGKNYADSMKLKYVDIVKGKADTVNVQISLAKLDLKKKLIKPRPDQGKIVKPVRPTGDSGLIGSLPVKVLEETVNVWMKSKVNPGSPDNDTVANVFPDKKTDEFVAVNTKTDTFVRVKEEKIKAEELIIPVKTDTVLVILPEIKKEEPAVISIKTDTLVSIQPETIKEEPLVIPVKSDSVVLILPAIKNEEPAVISAKTDTLVSIQPEIKKVEPEVIVEKKDTLVNVHPENEKIADSIVIAVSETIVAEKKPDSIIKVEKPVEKENAVIRSGTVTPFAICREEATGDDFLGLLKKIERSESDNGKLYQAHKAFTKKCYTTKQIERLSLLFMDDMGRYKFFDDAYQYVTDRENFPRLATFLTDEYYINRFKAMLR